jgi:hypothetical protein
MVDFGPNPVGAAWDATTKFFNLGGSVADGLIGIMAQLSLFIRYMLIVAVVVVVIVIIIYIVKQVINIRNSNADKAYALANQPKAVISEVFVEPMSATGGLARSAGAAYRDYATGVGNIATGAGNVIGSVSGPVASAAGAAAGVPVSGGSPQSQPIQQGSSEPDTAEAARIAAAGQVEAAKAAAEPERLKAVRSIIESEQAPVIERQKTLDRIAEQKQIENTTKTIADVESLQLETVINQNIAKEMGDHAVQMAREADMADRDAKVANREREAAEKALAERDQLVKLVGDLDADKAMKEHVAGNKAQVKQSQEYVAHTAMPKGNAGKMTAELDKVIDKAQERGANLEFNDKKKKK